MTSQPSDLKWRKAQASVANGRCVEVAMTAHGDVVVRDSKHHEQEMLAFTWQEWKAFIEAVKDGEFDYTVGAFKGFGPPPMEFNEETFGPMTPIQAVPVDEPDRASVARSAHRLNCPVC